MSAKEFTYCIGIGSQDCAILQSLLNDGDYEIADEDHIALEAVINILISDTDDQYSHL